MSTHLAPARKAGNFRDLLQVQEFYIELLKTGYASSPICCHESLKWVLALDSNSLNGNYLIDSSTIGEIII